MERVERLGGCVVLCHCRPRWGLYTVNIDIFKLYIFLRNSRFFLNVRENMYTTKITFIIP